MKKFMIFFLDLLNTIQLFHWNTTSYAAHKASDHLYHALQPLVDKFIEIGLQKRLGSFEEKAMMCHKTLPKMKTYLRQCATDLTKLSLEKDLANLRDEMVGEIHQFLYLVQLKE
jgi:hypothetical protein